MRPPRAPTRSARERHAPRRARRTPGRRRRLGERRRRRERTPDAVAHGGVRDDASQHELGRDLRAAPADPLERITWRRDVARVAAYRDRYEISDTTTPVPDEPGRGVQESARLDARAAADRLRDRHDDAEAAPLDESGRDRARTQTSSRIDDLLRRTRQTKTSIDLETLADRLRRQRTQPGPQPDDDHRDPGVPTRGPRI